jgi:hypothetical protein
MAATPSSLITLTVMKSKVGFHESYGVSWTIHFPSELVAVADVNRLPPAHNEIDLYHSAHISLKCDP